MNSITPAEVRQRATAAHMPLSRLLKRAGVSQSVFWRWEHGHTTAHPVTEQKLFDALKAVEAERCAPTS